MTDGRDEDEERTDAGDAEPPPVGRPSSRRFSLLLVMLIGAWNAYTAFAADSSRAALPPTFFVGGAVGLGVAVAGPERFKIWAFFVGAALCLAGFAAAG